MTARLRRALAEYWSLPASSELIDQQTARVRAIRGWEALRGTIPAYRGRPSAFVKVFGEGVSFEREQRGLAAGRAVAECGQESVRVPAVLCAVPPALALVIERVYGTVLNTSLRRVLRPSFGAHYGPTFDALGTWLQRFHAQECALVSPADLLQPHVEFIRLNLAAAEPRLGSVRAKRAERLLDVLVGEIDAAQPRPVHCHGDFQPDNMILSNQGVYMVDFAYARVGYPEQDLVLLRHTLTANSSDLPFGMQLMAPLWSSFLTAYGYRPDMGRRQPTWDFFELRYQSFSVRWSPSRDEHSARRTVLRMFRHLRGVRRFRDWVDRYAQVYGV